MEGFLNRNSGSSTTIFSSPLHSSSVTGLQFQPVNLPTSSPTFGSTSMRRPLFNSIQKKILVLDLDETLVHASTNFSEDCDFSLRLSISGSPCNFYVFKRPHVELFLEMVCKWFHVVIFTASVQQYANPVIDRIDPKKLIKYRLFRPNCRFEKGVYIKDLSTIYPDLSKIIIIDNSPVAYSLNKENGVPISSFMGDNPNDDELLGLIPFLHALQFTTDVRSILSLKGPTLGSESNDNNINNNSPPITTNIEPILPKYNYSIKHYIFFLFLVLVLGLAHNPNAYLAWMFAEFFEKILPLILLYSFIGIWAYRKSLFYSSTQIPYRWK